MYSHWIFGTDPNVDLRSDDSNIAESVHQVLIHVSFQILLREDVMPLRSEVGKHSQALEANPVAMGIPIESFVPVNEQVQEESPGSGLSL